MRLPQPVLDYHCRLAEEAGLDPNQIPSDSFALIEDVIHYRYVVTSEDGQPIMDGDMRGVTEWMTVPVGGGK